MKNKYWLTGLCLLSVFQSFAQTVIPLWEGLEKPYFKESELVETEVEVWGTTCVQDITEPSLILYSPQNGHTGKAVLVIPGGGYSVVAMYHEGYDVAEKLSQNGITAAVLKYRLPNPLSSDQPEKVPLADARRAMEILREKSSELKIDQVGVLGFSAGSHLATVLSVWPSPKQESKPDFSVLIYGVTEMTEANQEWLEQDLFHRPMTANEIKEYTLLERVDESTPPAFLVHSYDDQTCFIQESTLYAEVLRAQNVPLEMHLFEKGDHGFGLGRENDGTNGWSGLLVRWLQNADW
ncbi:MAG: alpha/beta hydrolase [Reichenbachiella sp.]